MFIQDLACISAQRSFNGEFFLEGPILHKGVQYMAQEPDYAGIIPLGQLRRMGRSVRMANGVGVPLLQKWPVNGIILGTTDGGMGDCHRFLDQIFEYDEGTLTPTNFVQGAPGASAGGLALATQNSGYNNTHSNKGISFENSVIDAAMLLEEGVADRLLIGAVEEISDAQFNIERLAGYIKAEETGSEVLLQSNTPGTANGEGAVMMVVCQEREGAKAEIVDTTVTSTQNEDVVLKVLTNFLTRNAFKFDQIDAIVLGLNGDGQTDHYYHHVAKEFPSAAGILVFKHLFGENPSATAFAAWAMTHAFNGAQLPKEMWWRPASSQLKNVLIYNHFQGQQHGFLLMRAVN